MAAHRVMTISQKLIMNTEKPRYNESEGTKGFVLYSRDFVVEGYLNYKINYRGTENQFLYFNNFVIKGVFIPRFQCKYFSSRYDPPNFRSTFELEREVAKGHDDA
jgi:hypothetical protein